MIGKIRILQVVGKMHYGGMETLIMNIYRNIDRNKVQFDFLVHYPEEGEYDEEIKKLGGKIYHMPRTVPQNYFIYKKALDLFFREHKEYQIVHGHLQSTAFLYHKIAKKNGVKCCITHSHNNGYDKNMKGILSYYTSLLAQNYTDVFFGCSQSACELYFPKAIKEGKRITIINNGIESEKYIFNLGVRNIVRRKLGIENQFVIGHVGRFSYQKNHKFLLEVYKEILKKIPNSVLLLVGEGPLLEQIKEIIVDMQLQKHVKLLGPRGDVNRLMQGMDVFVLPSCYEGLGIVLIEAQAAGLKCFTSAGVVPQEAKITDLLSYLPLNNDAKYWADKIILARYYQRQNTQKNVIKNGFDIKSTARFLQNFYIHQIDNVR